MLTKAQQDRIQSLDAYLRRIAGNLVNTHYPGQEVDELHQIMSAFICQQVHDDPAFLHNTDTYITRRAAWWCRDLLRSADKRGPCYGDHRRAYSLDQNLPGTDGLTYGDTHAATAADLDIAIAVRQALSTLPQKRQQIAQMLMDGWKQTEIAQLFGVKKQAVSYDVRQIKLALAPVYAAYTAAA
jgi:DNA-directed RNA polymerase specialized sigma24 family protein